MRRVRPAGSRVVAPGARPGAETTPTGGRFQLPLRTAFANAVLAGLNGLFAWAHLASFLRHPRPSLLLIVLTETAFALLFLLRRPAERTLFSARAWVATVVGSFSPLLLRPGGATSDLLAGEIVQVAGSVLAIAGALSLRRSFGLLPAQRGVKTGGLYRWVRHPLYLAYAVSQIGYLLSNATARNVLIFAVGLGCQVLRIRDEERLLSEYPEYRVYRTRTRWRLMPWVY